MNSAPFLFPVWQLWAGSVVPVHRRIVWQSDESTRQFVAYLGIVRGKATLTIRAEEDDLMVVSVGRWEADGLGSLARSMTWAEWVISDVLSEQTPRRSRKGGAKRHKEAA